MSYETVDRAAFAAALEAAGCTPWRAQQIVKATQCNCDIDDCAKRPEDALAALRVVLLPEIPTDIAALIRAVRIDNSEDGLRGVLNAKEQIDEADCRSVLWNASQVADALEILGGSVLGVESEPAPEAKCTCHVINAEGDMYLCQTHRGTEALRQAEEQSEDAVVERARSTHFMSNRPFSESDEHFIRFGFRAGIASQQPPEITPRPDGVVVRQAFWDEFDDTKDPVRALNAAMAVMYGDSALYPKGPQ